MSAVAAMPAWSPPIQPPPALKKGVSSKDSSKAAESISSEPPTMGFDELWGMVEKNMGAPLIQTNLGGK
jgi:hypothetical protein